jgi:hypothetical protein
MDVPLPLTPKVASKWIGPRLPSRCNSRKVPSPCCNCLCPAPAGIVHKRHWLNVLVGNPAGYLPEQARTSSIRLHLPYREFIPIGPSWMRGWEAVYFLSALVVSLWLRWRWKLN